MQLKYTVLLALLPLTYAHFSLNFPPTMGFSDDDEDKYPCGGFDVQSRKLVTDLPVAGAPISVTSTHPQDTWFFRAALLNDTENWVDLQPAVDQQGTGKFCASRVRGPAGWENQDAVLQVVAIAPDGFLFQCAAVRFIGGVAITPADEQCVNDTRVTASFSDETIILDASTTITGLGTQPTGVGSSRPSSSSPAPTRNAAIRREGGLAMVGGVVGAIGLLLV
ncbi:hypothetical protein TWF694_010063 [Orbilia ellipsospora]|uniref:Copper acquisition factor BIM1-like domain-containing protein n=1 Tax=Orbilia ellipsospora TaxID=2528407 RepID=A0AAV9X8R4_9PEZI